MSKSENETKQVNKDSENTNSTLTTWLWVILGILIVVAIGWFIYSQSSSEMVKDNIIGIAFLSLLGIGFAFYIWMQSSTENLILGNIIIFIAMLIFAVIFIYIYGYESFIESFKS